MKSKKVDESMKFETANRESFADLVNAMNESLAPVAFIGAGVSRDAGYPSWGMLLDRLHEATYSEKTRRSAEAKSLKDSPDLLWRASFYARKLEDRFPTALKRALKSPGGKVGHDLSTKLADIRFAHFLTTNYDGVMASALKKKHGRSFSAGCVIDSQATRAMRDFLATIHAPGTPRLVHLHGRIEKPSSIILTDEDYVRRYRGSYHAERELFAILATRRIVFVGFSMNDPELKEILRVIRADEAGAARHFALLPWTNEDDAMTQREYYRLKYGVQPIFFMLRKNSFVDLALILEKLANPSVEMPGHVMAIGKKVQHERAAVNTKPITNADDPQKGRWGEKPERNGRELTAEVERLDDGWYEIKLTVKAVGKRLLYGPVDFHVHDSFPSSRYRAIMDPSKRSASYVLEGYGAFTVGAVCDFGRTKLELDLADLRTAPRDFRDS
jgi:NAD-dependent SIR2 family protein deacetylase